MFDDTQLLLGGGNGIVAGSRSSRAGGGDLFAHERGDEVAGGNIVDGQLALDQALAIGYVVELLGAVTELGDEVGLQLPHDGVELIEKDVRNKISNGKRLCGIMSI